MKHKIMNCTCEHKFQDKKFGYKKRAFNECEGNTVGKEYRCTVCGKDKRE